MNRFALFEVDGGISIFYFLPNTRCDLLNIFFWFTEITNLETTTQQVEITWAKPMEMTHKNKGCSKQQPI